jgi:hypothetical protein
MMQRAARYMNAVRFHLAWRTMVFLWLCVALAVVVAVGCGGNNGPPTYRAGGKVAYSDGTPLTRGRVSLSPTESTANVSARGEIQPDGTFELTTFISGDGAVPGRYKALVVVPPVFQNPRWGPSNPPSEPLINARFANFETSGLEFTVTDDPAKNQFNIVVTK